MAQPETGTRGRDEASIRSYYDAFSERYDRGRGEGYHALLDDLEVEVATPFARNGKVLEVGCGTGRILSRLGEVAKEAQGVDLSEGMAAHARARGLSVTVAPATALPFEDERFDLVCSFKVLAHVPDVAEAIAEAARVTRPGGHMLLEFYNPVSLRYLVKRLGRPGRTGAHQTEDDVYTRWDAPWVIPRLLPPNVELSGFRGIRVITPAAAVHRLPRIGSATATLERALLRSPLGVFGGFLVAVLRKRAQTAD